MYHYALVKTKQTTVEPLTADEVREHVKQDQTVDDVLISRLIQAVREEAETFLNRQLLTGSYRMYLDDVPTDQRGIAITNVRLPMAAPLISVDAVTYNPPLYLPDGTGAAPVVMVANKDYGIDTFNEPGQMILLNQWPDLYDKLPGAFYIDYTCGYADPTLIPAAIKAGMLLRIGALYQNRETEVVGAVVDVLPSAVERLWWPWRVSW